MFLVLLAHDQHGSFVRPLVQEEPVAHKNHERCAGRPKGFRHQNPNQQFRGKGVGKGCKPSHSAHANVFSHSQAE